MTLLRVLLVEDVPADADLILGALRQAGFEVIAERVETAQGLQQALHTGAWDVILCDHVPGLLPYQVLEQVRGAQLDIPVLIVSGVVSDEEAVQILRAGARDLIHKGKLVRLAPAIERELSTARLRQEQRLQAARSRTLLTHGIDALVWLDAAGTITYASPSTATVLGYTPEQLIETNGLSLVHPDSRSEAAQHLAELVAAPGQTIRVESKVRHQDGSWRWIESVSTNLLADPDVSAIVVNFRDITQHKRDQQRLTLQYEVASVLAEASTGDALPRLLGVIGEHAEWPLGLLWTVDEEAGQLRCTHVWHSEGASVEAFARLCQQYTFKSGIGLPGRVWATSRPAWLADATVDPNFPRVPSAIAHDLHAAVAFPILLEGKVRGVMEFLAHEIGEPDDELFAIMRVIGHQIGHFWERQRAEAALRDSEARYRTLTENAPEAIITIDANRTILFANPATARIFGYDAEALLGREITLLMPEYLHHVHRAAVASYVATGVRRLTWTGIELPGLHQDGHEIPLEISFGEFTEQGQQRFTGFIHDITDRKRTQAELVQREERFRALVEGGADGLLLLDAEGAILYTGPPILGHIGDEWRGRSAFTLIHPDDLASTVAQFQDVITKSGAVATVQHRARHRNGSWRWVEAIVKNRLNDATVGGVVVNYRDITDRKQFEERLRQTQKLESLGVLAGGIAHDFNNLLTGIMGNTSLALDFVRPESPARGALQEILGASERAALLTRQLLAYAGKGRFIIEPIHLSHLVREMSTLIQRTIPKNVQLRLELCEDLPAVEGDTGQLQQVVMNLIINAAEAIPDDTPGTVLITTAVQEVDESYLLYALATNKVAPGLYVTLEVHDTGCGMEQETMARMFDPFFTTKFLGRGLGLAAVQGIVRGHKGAIKVYSTSGKGTTFKLLFPASRQPARPDPDRQAAAAHGSGTILVVDDEETVRRTAKAILERHGYAVLVAENGRAALELFRAHAESIRLVVLDLTMPVMGGEEALRQLKILHPDVKVILASGYNEIEVVTRFAGKGLAGFIQKPYTTAQLADMVSRSITE